MKQSSKKPCLAVFLPCLLITVATISYSATSADEDILGVHSDELKSFDEAPYFSPLLLRSFAGAESDGVDEVLISSVNLLSALNSDLYTHNHARIVEIKNEKWVYAENDYEWVRYRAQELDNGFWAVQLVSGPLDGRMSFRDNLIMTLYGDQLLEWDASVSRMRPVPCVFLHCAGKLPFNFFDHDTSIDQVFSEEDGNPVDQVTHTEDGKMLTKLAAQHPEYVEYILKLLAEDASLDDEIEGTLDEEIETLLRSSLNFFMGEGVEQSAQKGIELIDVAISKGSVIAIYNKALAYIMGYGELEKDFELAKSLMVEASDKGHKESFEWLSIISEGDYSNWNNIPEDFMIKMNMAGALSGNADGYYETGLKYYTGFDGTEVVDYKKAFDYLLSAAKQDHVEAQFLVGNMYENGNGVLKDQVEAMHWYQKAANAGDVNAFFYIGLNYFEGRGGSVDYVEAAKWFLLAAKNGHIQSMFNHGLCCYLHHGGDLLGYKDDRERTLAGLSWFEKAASYNHLQSIKLAALLNASEDPYPHNIERAVAYALIAWDQGDQSIFHMIQKGEEIDETIINKAEKIKLDIVGHE